MASDILVNTGSGNDLLSDGNKPLPEPMSTYHQRDPLAFIPGLMFNLIIKISTSDIWKVHVWNQSHIYKGAMS